jgi:hypothetical protein
MGTIKKIIDRLRVWFLPKDGSGRRHGCVDENRIVSLGTYTYGDTVKERFSIACPENIDYITGDCSCTTAYLDGDEVVVHIDTNKTVQNGSTTPHNKYVTVYYDKDEPYFIGDDKKQRVVNTKKRSAYINLSFVTTKKR